MYEIGQQKQTIKKNKLFVKFDIGRDKEDAEKAVTPVVIFINVKHDSFEANRDKSLGGFMIAIGWWDFSIKIFCILK